MEIPELNKNSIAAIGILLFFMAIAGILRFIPAMVASDLAFLPVYDTDTWYNLRQIEVMVHNFPQYNWFDPLTAYPQGKLIDWGPLYPFLASLLCLMTGASSQSAIISTAGFLSPLLGVCMVPVMYLLGKAIGDRITGLVAAGLIPFTSMLFFSYSSYGMVDHHAAEVFFSSCFFLVYLFGLGRSRRYPADVKETASLLPVCMISALAGTIYFLGLITSTTVILALLVVAIYTVVQAVCDYRQKIRSDYLLIQNILFLCTATIFLFFFGFKSEGISFSQYSVGIVYLHAAVVAGTIVIWSLAAWSKERPAFFYSGLGALAAAIVILMQIVPVLQSVSRQALGLLFGFSVYSVGVEETLPWSWTNAFETVNLAVILAAGGFLVLAFTLWKTQQREQIFFGVWSVLMLLITIQHQRFLYYFTINIVLLSAICITEPFRWKISPVHRLSVFKNNRWRPPGDPEQKSGGREKSSRRKKTDTNATGRITRKEALAGFCLAAVCLVAIAHVGISVQQDFQYGVNAKLRVIPEDWRESLDWLKKNTPDPGIDYFGQYDAKNYTAPPGSYGIIAVWDAGHWITFFSHRPPVTNPFQDNLAGNRGTAAFFLAENETRAASILKLYRGRYVVTDSSMAVDRFTNLVPWQSGSVDISRYIKWFLLPDPSDPLVLKKVHKYDTAYFQALVTRLHIFDGSMAEPTTAEYTTYSIRLPKPQETADATGYSRVITGETVVNVSALDNTTPLIPEGPELLPTDYAALYSGIPFRPLSRVPALQHFRLVFESEKDAAAVMFPESAGITLPGIKNVKIFEFVNGAHIPGTGTIELSVETNTGRSFVYRQESAGGEFIVPYSTTGNPYGVRATGPYHVAGTGRYYTVTEDDVKNGKTIAA